MVSCPERARRPPRGLYHPGVRRRFQLREVPVEERAPILLAYVQRRAFTRSPKRVARLYFGLEAPTLQDVEKLATRFPVFAIEEPAA